MTVNRTPPRANPLGFRRDIQPPSFAVPPGACDTHMHIVGPFGQYPLRETRSLQPPESTLGDYLGMKRATGIERNVIVQPSFFAKDNACTLDSAEQMGEHARAVVVVEPDVDEDTLAAMHARGARGVRLQRVVAGGTSVDEIAEIAAKIQPFGWHVQLFIDSEDIEALIPLLRRLPVPVVFDHMAHVYQGSSMTSPGFRGLHDLLSEGKAWVKLSAWRFSPDDERARALVSINAQRVLWGSDWPHVSYEEDVPDDGQLLNRLAQWAQDPATLHGILVDNPAQLYFQDQQG
ncbi:amidohydrolase family protein [Paraburkholderia sp. Ac-20336]|nr:MULTISPECIES: amidohydrolase family protein [Burkholderiaceae]MBN3804295.1 amidohydrolase family protein [Paraburkholderia sp. Ac-20336]MBN3850081.1 amidohydrolase family protein [Paraburkholderia sp. Ac-20342]NIF51603.1 amidohydrolase family protein [Burkholderia sp. Ax-1724]NIF80447.1 amidohydrolase family protein [Paraburkholderia sp. Cy-641]